MNFSAFSRPQILDKLQHSVFDVLVIGGGITGAGIALDAQTRGMQVALVEMQDFASGTSSRSTKLIHGGLRYLKQLEFKIVAETGRERAIVYKNAPHVTVAQPMLLPIVEGGSLSRFTTNAALWVYDLLAGVKKSERRKMLSKKQTLDKEPTLNSEKLLGGAFYYEYRTDDARLTIEILKKAVECGTVALNYSQVVDFLFENGKVCGVKVADQFSQEVYEIRAKQVVNASGPWVDTIDVKNDASKPPKLLLSKGVHIVVDFKKLPLKQSVYFDVPDGRMIFAIPRQGKTYIGTTDTFYESGIAEPQITLADIAYLLTATKNMFPAANLTLADIESGWAGLRPLIKQTGRGASEISRKDEIFQYDSGLITIAGGKLTGYRKMAERVVNRIALKLYEKERLRFKPCQTINLLLSGAIAGGNKAFEAYKLQKLAENNLLGLSEEKIRYFLERYGTHAEGIFELIKIRSNNSGLPAEIFAELTYCIENEMVVKPADFFTRRTGATYFNITWVKKYKDLVIEVLAHQLDWTRTQQQQYAGEFENELANILPNSQTAIRNQ
ncbi:MAG: FAD-dependent oxidoreductase [Verrucomicrobia bacterium]|nr:FAD-dependent oxidoreductase [Cytophagales bacterium]